MYVEADWIMYVYYYSVCFVGMDVYRNFRRHFPKDALPKKGLPAEIDNVGPRKAPSPLGKGKAESKSDVQLGLQQLAIAVPGDGPARHIVRLFVIPSTSGLAAGYTVSPSIS